ncbi:hypothetical protein FHN55_06210 [Streptomyces sp. NP160]|uniref:DUF6919 domain-containing protein n=1 Tax=Streptomyces sp. NP160 TaxID=2586637 RepID=UPI00111A4C6E|nr:hypothetical protein [Streptomyces sp. NP160]TNM68796.1 hypothetical protein FHN55_06210 [Streptomyces sp. NP160]
MGLTIDRRQWRGADSLAAIGELTARWLEGDLAYQPEDFATEAAPETRPLVPVLAAFNRADYVTTNSQPGVVLRAGSGQRAFVTGYCGELSMRRLERAVANTHLVPLSFKPGDDEVEPVAVTMRDAVETTWLGRPVSADYIRQAWDRDVAPMGVAALLAALI